MDKNDQKNLLESDLREWLRNTWGKGGHGLDWIEPTRGSSVGVPDVMIPVYPRLIPVELKINRQRKNSRWFTTPVRPAQIRYHQSLMEDRFISAFLIANGERDCFDVWAMPGFVEIWKAQEKIGWYCVAVDQTRKGMKSRENLKNVLETISKEFYPIDKQGNHLMPW